MNHSGHDVGLLLERWEGVIEKQRWEKTIIAERGGFPILCLRNRAALEFDARGAYLSTGVHGDECAPPWALLRWAESISRETALQPLTIFPCLNPVGVIENTRVDGEGVDLNREFHDSSHPLLGAWQKSIADRCFDVSVHLHEDYDTAGIYLYELSRSRSWGDSYLSACEELIPRENSAMVDGSEFENGLLFHDEDENEIRRVVAEELGGGMPEAIYLYLEHTDRSYTFETPSECDLELRIRTHQRFLEAVVGK
ncbi:MAG: M14 family metallocarboxypeptidase [Verrucomicrobiota bacterium]